jgi:hypothetical protein
MADHEQAFWGNCSNTFGEELKQLKYAELMRLQRFGDGRSPFCFWGYGLSWIDFGGGPSSLLLKMRNMSRAPIVLDPLPTPDWVTGRYAGAGVIHLGREGERPFTPLAAATYGRDIGLCYNVLQHVENPEQFVANLKALSKVQVVFEWINLPPHDGHPNMLTQELLEGWFGPGFVGKLEGENECWGEFWCKPLRTEDLVDLGAEPYTDEAAKAWSFPNG